MFRKDFVFSVTDPGVLEVRLQERSNKGQNDIEDQKMSPGAILEHTLLGLGQRIRDKSRQSPV